MDTQHGAPICASWQNRAARHLQFVREQIDAMKNQFAKLKKNQVSLPAL
jgi:hypothetical protein